MQQLNSLSNDKILDLTKLKAFADDNFNVVLMVQFLAPLAVGQPANVMARCPLCIRPARHELINISLSDFDEVSQKCSCHGSL